MKACFLCLIAKESVNKYMAKALIVEVSLETSSGLISPAVTFCPRYPNAMYVSRINMIIREDHIFKHDHK